MAFTLNYTGLRITDTISAALTVSKTAYNSASINTLVPITEAEYNSIFAISGAYKAATSDSNIAGATGGLSSTPTIAQTTSFTSASTGNIITSASYLTAFRVRVTAGSSFAVNSVIGYGTTATSAGTSLATVATTGVSDVNGNVYFVVKQPSILAPTGSLPRIFRATGGGNLSFNSAGGQTSYNSAATSFASFPNQSLAGTPSFQFIMNTIKQW